MGASGYQNMKRLMSQKGVKMEYNKPKIVAEGMETRVHAADRCQDYSRNINVSPVTCRR